MLTGQKLGDALREAIRLKGVTKTEVAEHFGVKPPSIHDWMNTGRIGKQHLTNLVLYFSDVAGPEHWGMSRSMGVSQPARLDPDLLQIAAETAAAIVGRKVTIERDAEMIAETYDELATLAGKPVPPSVIVSLTQRFGGKHGSK